MTLSDSAITVENLSKCYAVGHNAVPADSYASLRDVVTRNVHNLIRKTRDMLHGRPVVQGDEVEEFWALSDVSFNVRRGDQVGIIGRNGAGKSTLLKILSRITTPTKGRIQIDGRIASLLEVGTGFHPELTGRENIFLNGAILGMSRTEVTRKFDEIVDFAGVERFLDTPVKRYSSGMYLRLAFAVSAHLEPEILVVDEVLAVGDAEFQRKCLGRMKQFGSEGRTVLFVSHNIEAIENICNKGLYLKDGRTRSEGDIASVIGCYLNEIESLGDVPIDQRKDREGLGSIRINDVQLSSLSVLRTNGSLIVTIDYASRSENITPVEFGISIWSENEVRLISISSDLTGGVGTLGPSGVATCVIPRLPLVAGNYFINVFVSSMNGIEDYILRARKMVIENADVFGYGKSVNKLWGAISVDHHWEY